MNLKFTTSDCFFDPKTNCLTLRINPKGAGSALIDHMVHGGRIEFTILTKAQDGTPDQVADRPEGGDRLPFEEDAIRGYLDGAITRWRVFRETANDQRDQSAVLMARYYIDAFQSVRASIFGSTLAK